MAKVSSLLWFSIYLKISKLGIDMKNSNCHKKENVPIENQISKTKNIFCFLFYVNNYTLWYILLTKYNGIYTDDIFTVFGLLLNLFNNMKIYSDDDSDHCCVLVIFHTIL